MHHLVSLTLLASDFDAGRTSWSAYGDEGLPGLARAINSQHVASCHALYGVERFPFLLYELEKRRHDEHC